MLFKDLWPSASSTISLPYLKHFLYLTGKNIMFSTSTMARTRIGIKLNHTHGMEWRNTWSEACWSVRICYLDRAVGCRCSCLGWRDAVSSVPARPVPGLSLSQDLRIWVQLLWDAGQVLKGYVHLRVGVPKGGEMELSWSKKIPIQTFCLAAAKPQCLSGFYFIFAFKLLTWESAKS